MEGFVIGIRPVNAWTQRDATLVNEESCRNMGRDPEPGAKP